MSPREEGVRILSLLFYGDSYAFGRRPTGDLSFEKAQDRLSTLTIPNQGGVENIGVAS